MNFYRVKNKSVQISGPTQDSKYKGLELGLNFQNPKPKTDPGSLTMYQHIRDNDNIVTRRKNSIGLGPQATLLLALCVVDNISRHTGSCYHKSHAHFIESKVILLAACSH